MLKIKNSFAIDNSQSEVKLRNSQQPERSINMDPSVLSRITQDLETLDVDVKVNALVEVRMLLSLINPPIAEVVQSGLIPVFVELIDHSRYEKCYVVQRIA